MKLSSKWRFTRWIGARSCRGTSITEIMLFLFVGAITIGYAVPNFKDFVINNRVISGTNLVVSALNFARTEAIKRGIPVSTCASSDYSNCTAAGWHDGWMVFTDEPIAGVIDGPDSVLRTQQGVELDITLVGQDFIRFAPNGSLAGIYQDSDEFEGFVDHPYESPYEPTPLNTLVANLLPINSAHAAGGSGSGGTGGGSGSGGGGTGGGGGGVAKKGGGASANAAVFTFKVCPRNAGYKGRTIQITAMGRIYTTESTCS